MKLTRGEVHGLIDGELVYQITKLEERAMTPEDRSISDYLECMRVFLNEASVDVLDSNKGGMLDQVRAIGALAVTCMAVHGGRERECLPEEDDLDAIATEEKVEEKADGRHQLLVTALEKIRSETCVMGSEYGDHTVHSLADEALRAYREKDA